MSSWFQQGSSFTSLASKALKNAQKKIDKALDIKEEDAAVADQELAKLEKNLTKGIQKVTSAVSSPSRNDTLVDASVDDSGLDFAVAKEKDVTNAYSIDVKGNLTSMESSTELEYSKPKIGRKSPSKLGKRLGTRSSGAARKVKAEKKKGRRETSEGETLCASPSEEAQNSTTGESEEYVGGNIVDENDSSCSVNESQALGKTGEEVSDGDVDDVDASGEESNFRTGLVENGTTDGNDAAERLCEEAFSQKKYNDSVQDVKVDSQTFEVDGESSRN